MFLPIYEYLVVKGERVSLFVMFKRTSKVGVRHQLCKVLYKLVHQSFAVFLGNNITFTFTSIERRCGD